MAPPPCLWEPIGNAVSGSNYILQQFPNPAPDTPFWRARVGQAGEEAAGDHAGAQRARGTCCPINPAAGPTGEQACLRLPLFFFAVPGQALPPAPIPPRTLAEFAYNHMLIPRPSLTLNPAAGGYVNLGTYVWGSWAASPTTGRMNAYKITATLGGQTVTVWAQASGFAVNVTGPGTPYSALLRPDRVPLPAGPGTGLAPGRASRRTAGALAGAHHRRRADRHGPLGRHLGVGNLTAREQRAAADPDDRARPARQRPGEEIQSVNGG